MVATRGLIAASTSPFAMPMVSLAAKRTRKFGAAIVAMVPAMWPIAARRRSVPIPSRSHSGPPSRIDRPNPQNAAPAIHPTSVLLRPKSRSKSLMMSPRMANVIAVARSATQLATNRRRWFIVAPWRRARRYYYTAHGAQKVKGGVMKVFAATALAMLLCWGCTNATARATAQNVPQLTVALQPLAQQVRRVETALSYLGQPLSAEDSRAIDEAISLKDEERAVQRLQTTLDKYALAIVRINPDSRVSVEQGPATPEAVEGGTRLFLVKVLNEAQVTAPLRLDSPNNGNVFIGSDGSPEPRRVLTERDARERWASISIYDKQPMTRRLSGLAVEYVILEIFSRDSGQRSAQIAFSVGQGTQDVGYRNDLPILFTALPARTVTFRVRDEHGKPAVASFLIRDRFDRIYPNRSKRLAPDFPFQPQIYRGDGESIRLPEGRYTVVSSGGPEYLTRTTDLRVEADQPAEIAVTLERWIDPAKQGWYSGDHHVHAAGCSHY